MLARHKFFNRFPSTPRGSTLPPMNIKISASVPQGVTGDVERGTRKSTLLRVRAEESETGHRLARIVFEEREDARTIERGDAELSIGIKDMAKTTRRAWMRLVRLAIREAQARKRAKVAIELASLRMGEMKKADEADLCKTFAENAILAGYEFRSYKTKPKDGWPEVHEVVLIGDVSVDGKKTLAEGVIIATEMNAARELINTPAGAMTPKTLAKAAKDALKGLPVSVRALGRAQMQKLGMGALLGVGQGSPSEPQLIVFEYRGAGAKEKPIALVGKGITFDSGGLNVKPSGSGMHEMHMDMSGGATVLHAVAAIARLKVKKNVVGIIAAAENMVSGESYRPGDILKSMSGKMIEVLNTDAEGRLVLSDALTYAQKEYDPRLILDVATLTGAASVALGTYASAILCRDAALAEKLREIGEETGDHAWPLPLLPEFAQNIVSKRADIANIATVSPRYGDTMMGAAFLAQFVDEDRAWAHIDMAPRMTPGPSDALADGSTGEPLRLLVESVRRM